MPSQSALVGHSPTSGTTNSAENAGTNAPNPEPPDAPKIKTAQQYKTESTSIFARSITTITSSS
jgi:hypothetical protein